MVGTSGVVYGNRGGTDGYQRECEQAGNRCLPHADGPPVSAAAGMKEVALCIAERQLADAIGTDTRLSVGSCLQQAAAVEVGAIAAVAVPFGGGAPQPGTDDPVGVGVG